MIGFYIKSTLNGAITSLGRVCRSLLPAETAPANHGVKSAFIMQFRSEFSMDQIELAPEHFSNTDTVLQALLPGSSPYRSLP